MNWSIVPGSQLQLAAQIRAIGSSRICRLLCQVPSRTCTAQSDATIAVERSDMISGRSSAAVRA